MLYLLLPTQTLQWVDLPATTTLRLSREKGVDLGGLPWEPAERDVDNELVRWALRHGVACAKGVVLHVGELSVIDRVGEMRSTHARYKLSREKLAASPINAAIERVIPGNAEEGRRLDAAVDASTAQAIEEAEAEHREAMAVEPDQTLIKHWTDLGGRLPTPV